MALVASKRRFITFLLWTLRSDGSESKLVPSRIVARGPGDPDAGDKGADCAEGEEHFQGEEATITVFIVGGRFCCLQVVSRILSIGTFNARLILLGG
jgi:hypothetical protein